MNKNVINWLLAFLISYLSISFFNIAYAMDEVEKITIAKNYRALKAKAQNQNKVRVIAKLKGVKKGKVKSSITPTAHIKKRNRLKRMRFNIQREFPRLGLVVLDLNANQLDRLIESGQVEQVVEDIPQPVNLIESTQIINADLVNGNGFRGAGQAVAILDTGVDSSHPFLESRIVQEACFSTTNAAYSASSQCPNGLNEQIGSGAAPDCASISAQGCSHGTHVAGIAAGSNLNMHGVSSNADIIAINVFSRFAAGSQYCSSTIDCLLSFTSDQIAALEWVLNNASKHNIASVNMSLGGGQHSEPCNLDSRANEIAELRTIGVATVISSGNNAYTNSVGAPGCISDAITIGSTDDIADSVSSFSNGSTIVDLLAPGQLIQSSIYGGAYANYQGTSMAAPHVAGAFAVIKGLFPDASIDQIEQAMKSAGVPVVDQRNGLTFPRLDLAATVDYLDASFLDVIIGDADNNSLEGDENENTLNGGAGDDILNGYENNDTLIGGTGNDTYVSGRYVGTWRQVWIAEGYDASFYHEDLIQEDDEGAGDIDTLKLVGVSIGWPDYVRYSRYGDDLLLTLTRVNQDWDDEQGDYDHVLENVRVVNYFLGSQYQIEKLEFSQGPVGARDDKVRNLSDLIDRYKYVYYATDEDDVINVDLNARSVYGLAGNDTIIGNANFSNYLLGGDGNDYIDGREGYDSLHGGAGNDIIIGGLGSDQLTGGEGVDTFVWSQKDVGAFDEVTDFNISGTQIDKLDLRELLEGEVQSAAVLDSYLDITHDRYGMTISVDVNGDGSGYDQTIKLYRVNLAAFGGDQSIIQVLLNNNQLITD